MRCTICGNEAEEELLHLPMYIDGSGGIDICYACKMDITRFICSVRSACARSRVAAKMGIWKGNISKEKGVSV